LDAVLEIPDEQGIMCKFNALVAEYYCTPLNSARNKIVVI